MNATPTLLTFLGGFALATALTPLVRTLARRGGFLAHPKRDRWHPDPVPVLGGYAIAAAFFGATALSTPLQPLLPLLVGAGAMFALGALDDMVHLGPTTKLIVQTIIASVVVFLMPPAHITGFAPLDALLSLIWIVGITNAFNLLDNMDGLSAGIAAIAGTFLPGGHVSARQVPADSRRRRIRRRLAGVPGLQRPARVDLHGRQRQPVSRVLPGGSARFWQRRD